MWNNKKLCLISLSLGMVTNAGCGNWAKENPQDAQVVATVARETSSAVGGAIGTAVSAIASAYFPPAAVAGPAIVSATTTGTNAITEQILAALGITVGAAATAYAAHKNGQDKGWDEAKKDSQNPPNPQTRA